MFLYEYVEGINQHKKHFEATKEKTNPFGYVKLLCRGQLLDNFPKKITNKSKRQIQSWEQKY